MHVFIYEYVTGGGCTDSVAPPSADASLFAQGRAMIQAVAADFCSLAGVEVSTTRDERLPPLHPHACHVTTIASPASERQVIEQLAAAADWTLLIAPETENCLGSRAALVDAAGGRLLSPSSALVALAADKHATAQWLSSRGIPTPCGTILAPGQADIPTEVGFPAVLKPIDGCGSAGLRLLRSTADIATTSLDRPMRLEKFIPGLAASVAILAGPAGHYSLPACQQKLTADGRFTYLGGRLPLPPALDRRARRLAESAIAALPTPLGYLGVDLALGQADDGSGDRVIEINPRLTTSYVGLRALSRTNLAAAMLAAAQGASPDLSFRSEPLDFTSEGTISRHSTTDK